MDKNNTNDMEKMYRYVFGALGITSTALIASKLIKKEIKKIKKKEIPNSMDGSLGNLLKISFGIQDIVTTPDGDAPKIEEIATAAWNVASGADIEMTTLWSNIENYDSCSALMANLAFMHSGLQDFDHYDKWSDGGIAHSLVNPKYYFTHSLWNGISEYGEIDLPCLYFLIWLSEGYKESCYDTWDEYKYALCSVLKYMPENYRVQICGHTGCIEVHAIDDCHGFKHFDWRQVYIARPDTEWLFGGNPDGNLDWSLPHIPCVVPPLYSLCSRVSDMAMLRQPWGPVDPRDRFTTTDFEDIMKESFRYMVYDCLESKWYHARDFYILMMTTYASHMTDPSCSGTFSFDANRYCVYLPQSWVLTGKSTSSTCFWSEGNETLPSCTKLVVETRTGLNNTAPPVITVTVDDTSDPNLYCSLVSSNGDLLTIDCSTLGVAPVGSGFGQTVDNGNVGYEYSQNNDYDNLCMIPSSYYVFCLNSIDLTHILQHAQLIETTPPGTSSFISFPWFKPSCLSFGMDPELWYVKQPQFIQTIYAVPLANTATASAWLPTEGALAGLPLDAFFTPTDIVPDEHGASYYMGSYPSNPIDYYLDNHAYPLLCDHNIDILRRVNLVETYGDVNSNTSALVFHKGSPRICHSQSDIGHYITDQTPVILLTLPNEQLILGTLCELYSFWKDLHKNLKMLKSENEENFVVKK